MICALGKEINNCRFCGKNMECMNPESGCSYRKDVTVEEKEERWYEKYYKNSRPKRG